MARSSGKGGDRDPIVCGHRGARAVVAENTIASFAEAEARGATWIEFDVRPTVDGALVVHHDPVTSEGVHVGSSPRSALRDDIPTLDELITTFPSLGLDIELKTDDMGQSIDAFASQVNAVIARGESAGGWTARQDARVIVTSFDPLILELIKAEHGTGLATGLLYYDRTTAWALETAIAAGHEAIAPHHPLVDGALMVAARAAGLKVLTWTVNKPADIARVRDLGVDMIIGDDPTDIVAVLDEADRA